MAMADEPTILETERLVFRKFTMDDLPLMVDLHSDLEVQRFLGGEWSSQVMRATLERLVLDDAAVGYSKWKAHLRDGTFVGRAGIQPFPRQGPERGRENELGYAFKTAAWGQGLATEAAQALVKWFFNNTSNDHLIAMTEPDHVVSQRVLAKIGMRSVGIHDVGLSTPHAIFRIDRPPT